MRIALLLVLALCALTAHAQGPMVDVVYLSNGSVIRGTIIEQVPNQSIKIQTADGSVFVYQMAQVTRITREATSPVVQQTPAGGVPVPSGMPSYPSSGGYPNAAGAYPAGYTPKNPTVSTLLSVVVPGGGQFYSGEMGKGAGLLLGTLAIYLGTAALAYNEVGDISDCFYDDYNDCYDEASDVSTVAYVGWAASLGLWAYGVLDAAPAAKRANAKAAGIRLSVTPRPVYDPASRGRTMGVAARLQF